MTFHFGAIAFCFAIIYVEYGPHCSNACALADLTGEKMFRFFWGNVKHQFHYNTEQRNEYVNITNDVKQPTVGHANKV